MKLLFFILTILLIVSDETFSQNKELYSILDEIISPNSTLKRKSIDPFINSYTEFVGQLATDKYLLNIPKNYDLSELTEILVPDSLYFREQIRTNFNWEKQEIDDKSIKVGRGLDNWILIRSFFSSEFLLKRSYYKISKPIFVNRENTAALIYVTTYSGPVSGSGGIYLFVKVGDNWKIIGYDPIYMS